MNGGTLKGLILMRFEGSAALRPPAGAAQHGALVHRP
jgi:hypothetical protein